MVNVTGHVAHGQILNGVQGSQVVSHVALA